VLKVDGSIASNTFVHPGATLAGAGTINGNASNNNRSTVSPGDSLKTLTVDGYTQKFGAFLIDIAGQFRVLNALGRADPNGYLTPVLLNGFTPEIGDSFTFIRCFEFGVSGSDEPFSRPLLHY